MGKLREEPLAIIKCTNCGNDVPIFHRKRLEYKHIFCSHKCESEWRKEQSDKNAECPICHKKFHLKPYVLNNGSIHCCSKECNKIWKSRKMSGEGNHQFGLKGDKNSSWKADTRISSYGYLLVRVLDHPFRNSDDFVFEHRLVAEKYLLTEENSIEINGKKYLRPEYAVHHKDFDRLNNSVDNLVVMLKGEHAKLHTKLKELEKQGKTKEYEELKQTCKVA